MERRFKFILNQKFIFLNFNAFLIFKGKLKMKLKVSSVKKYSSLKKQKTVYALMHLDSSNQTSFTAKIACNTIIKFGRA